MKNILKNEQKVALRFFSSVCQNGSWMAIWDAALEHAVRELAIPRHCYVPFPNLYLVIADTLSISIGCNCCIAENVTAMEHFCNCHSISADVDTVEAA